MSASSTGVAALHGLVLAGGRSRRMRQDKAALRYAGRPQLARAVELLASRVQCCYVSVRAEQRTETHRAAYQLIVDLQPDLGPLGGIQAALHAHPDHAWLVLACDLPLLSGAVLDHLIRHRAGDRLASAYRSSDDGLPEPLCAIFEPASREAIDRWILSGQRCPRALLAQSDALLLDPLDPRALDNINTPDEYAIASARLATQLADRQALHLTVHYFAVLREQAGRAQEQVQTQAHTPLELYRELREQRALALSPNQLRVAINEEFGDWRTPLRDGDTVAFLPPVAGG